MLEWARQEMLVPTQVRTGEPLPLRIEVEDKYYPIRENYYG